MNLSHTPKFHVLHEHTPSIIIEMNGFFDMGEDAIERWHQIRMRHHARIRSLRSAQVQKNCQEKYEHTCNGLSLKNIITNVNNTTKRNLKKDGKLSMQR